MKKCIGLALAVMLLVTAAACSDKGAEETDGSAPSTPLETTIEAFGVVQSAKVQTVALEFPARVAEVLVKEGQLVQKDEALLRLDVSSINSQIAIKEQELSLARSEGIQARISIAEQELAALRNRLDQPFLKEGAVVSPLDDAIVSEISYAAGDLVEPGRRVMKLSSLEGLVVKADVLEEFIKDVKVGAAVTIRPTADKSKEYTGKVTVIGKMAFQARSGETTVPVEISLDNADDFLLPGFNVELKIHK